MRDFDRPRLAGAHARAHAYALCAYAEPLARGNRVLVVADPGLDLGVRLTSLGARSVHLFDPSYQAGHSSSDDVPPTVAHSAVVRPLPSFDRGGDFDVRDGAYDFAFVPDLGAVPDPAALLARLRRVLGHDGALLAGARNPDRSWGRLDRRSSGDAYVGPERRARSIPYAELYDLASLQFANLRMLAQLPFRGLVIAELGLAEGEVPEVSVDTQVADDARDGRAPEPHFFFVLAAQRDVRLDAYTVLQLPDAESDVAISSASGSEGADVAALAAAQLRADVLRAQLEEEKANSARLADARGLESSARVTELELALAAKTQAAEQAEARAAENYARTERITGEVARLDDELRRERDRVLELTAIIGAERRDREQQEAEAETLRTRGLRAEVASKVAALEAALDEARLIIAAQEADRNAAQVALALRNEELARVLIELDRERSIAQAAVSARGETIDPAILDALTERAARAEAMLAEIETDLANVGELHADELAQLEAALRERGQALQTMEREILRRDRMVHELVAALEAAADAKTAVQSPASAPRPSSSADETARLRAQMEHLSMEMARREGELEARAWRIAELERELALAASSQQAPRPSPIAQSTQAPDAAAASQTEHALRAELDALRKALAQEHAAKVHAESGEGLDEARAELARQAVLIDQLSQKLATRPD